MSEQQNGLKPNDLMQILNLLQVTASRGAFREDEVETVRDLYHRIYAFLQGAGFIPSPDLPVADASVAAPVADAPVAPAAQ